MLEARGAACAVSVATCTRVCMHGVVLIIGSACRSPAVCCFCTRTRLVEWAGRAGVLPLVLLELCTLGTGGGMLIEPVTLLFTSVWGMGTPANGAPSELVALVGCL